MFEDAATHVRQDPIAGFVDVVAFGGGIEADEAHPYVDGEGASGPSTVLKNWIASGARLTNLRPTSNFAGLPGPRVSIQTT